MKVATALLEKFYAGHVIARLAISEEEFWKSKKLAFRDWSGESCGFDDLFSFFLSFDV